MNPCSKTLRLLPLLAILLVLAAFMPAGGQGCSVADIAMTLPADQPADGGGCADVVELEPEGDEVFNADLAMHRCDASARGRSALHRLNPQSALGLATPPPQST